jgi:hypothetical protein
LIAALGEVHRRAFDAIREAGGEMAMGRMGQVLGKRPEGCAAWRRVLDEQPEVFGFAGEGKEVRVRLIGDAAKVR